MTDAPISHATHWHPKVWGQEHWIVNSPAYCGKILHLHPATMCSLHHHPIKDETFYVIGGLVRVWLGATIEEALANHLDVSVGDSVRVAPGLWHRFGSHTGATIAEFSTHHDEGDVVRAEGHESGGMPW